MSADSETNTPSRSPAEVFLVFLKLGLTSFGGPVAHLGYFRTELVLQRRWVSDEQFGQLLAICQFLPGPASSQLGFCLGLIRAGWLGALAAFVAFTLPSVVLLVAFASLVPWLSSQLGQAIIQGLKLAACAVVADAVVGMSRKLCPDTHRRMIALLAVAVLLIFPSTSTQLFVVLIAGIVGAFWLTDTTHLKEATAIKLPFGPKLGGVLLLLFISLLAGLPFISTPTPNLLSVADTFYRAGALVFGGGHVVLPLLQDAVVTTGWVTPEQFLAGYGASQAIPGPLFAFSAYLGAVMSTGENSYLLAVTALLFIFLPGFLLVTGVLPFWRTISHHPVANQAVAGVNAAVVGLLAAALYNPIFTSGIKGPIDLVIALAGFASLAVWRVSPLLVVTGCVLASIMLNTL